LISGNAVEKLSVPPMKGSDTSIRQRKRAENQESNEVASVIIVVAITVRTSI
jgi:hypothetical protein